MTYVKRHRSPVPKTTKKREPAPPLSGAGRRKRGTQEAFLAAYAETLNIAGAAKAAGIDRSTHYEWMEHDPLYVKLFENHRRAAIEKAEAEAYRRAVEGTRQLRLHNGKPVKDPRVKTKRGQPPVYLEEVRYSDDLLKTVLRGNDARYRDRHEISGPEGGPIHMGGSVIDDEMRATVEAVSKDPKAAEAALLLAEAMARHGSA